MPACVFDCLVWFGLVWFKRLLATANMPAYIFGRWFARRRSLATVAYISSSSSDLFQVSHRTHPSSIRSTRRHVTVFTLAGAIVCPIVVGACTTCVQAPQHGVSRRVLFVHRGMRIPALSVLRGNSELCYARLQNTKTIVRWKIKIATATQPSQHFPAMVG